jgi:hypothetical protein
MEFSYNVTKTESLFNIQFIKLMSMIFLNLYLKTFGGVY